MNEQTNTKKELSQLDIDITERNWFNGLYDTIWNNENLDIDYIGDIADNLDIDIDDIEIGLDYNKYLNTISEIYCNLINTEMMLLDYNITAEPNGIYTPMYYNYDTDRIYISLLSDTLTVDEIEKAMQELEKANTKDNYLNIEGLAFFDYDGSSVYYELVEYTYKEVQLYYNMDREELDKELKALEN